MKTHFPLLLFLTFFLLIHSSSSQTISKDDAAVMLDLNKSLNPRTIWRNPDVCKWEQVTCTGGRVVKIQLKNLGLTGSLPLNLNKLTALEDFELQGNQIGGELPTLSGLDRLKTLILTGNIFSSIPSDFFTGMSSLKGVYLDQIPFKHWEIPESLVDASNLGTLSMNNASIKGNIPVFLNGSNFLGLTDLHLSFNWLEGGLPSSFAGFTSVQSLWLNGQRGTSKLSGPIDVLQNMTGLREVWLQTNQFSGPLPSDFSGLTGLSYFSVRDNQFTGPVPESLTKLEGLTVVNLTNNLLQGPTPVFVSKSVKVDMIAGSNRFCLNVPGKACDSRVDILLSCASSWGYPAPFAQDWKGNDPCNSWGGINCNNNGSIRSVVLERRNITGTISPSFAKLTSLEVLDLANNSLHGPIPKEIVDMPSIKEINLRNNQLTGGIPGTGDNPKKLKVDGNPDINKPAITPTPPGKVPPPGSPSHETPGTPRNGGNERKRVSPGVIVAIVIGSIAVVVLFSLLVLWFYKKKRHFTRVQSPNAMVVHPRHSGSDPEIVKITVAGSNMNVGAASETYSHTSSGTGDVQLVESGSMVISIQVLRNVTDNFSEDNILGRGGFGTVYKGELHDGTKIAVKRMESGVITGKGLTEFKSEIAVLTKVRHRHLVALLGYCLDGNERLLVYEYMPQGTLSQHLFNWKAEDLKPLEWTRRLTIALDVARGVEYLHGLAHQSFIHRDLKPSNILLGDDMRAKVADFGLVRLAPDGKASIETRLAGTFGYLAPEYAVTGRVTTKVDVYSFGVILMELITGRKALDERENEDSMHLVSWFRRMHINKETFQKAIDPVIELTEETLASVSTVAELAGHCSAREPYQRPDMGHAVNVLSSLVELWKPTEADSEDIYGIDLDMTLPQALKKWQAFEGSSRMDGDTSSFLASVDNTQTSIPTRPSGFADTFSSGDGR